MAIVFIEEVGAPIRVCSKQATADKLGIASADVDLEGITHRTEHYTLSGGVLVELTDVITEAAVVAEDAWIKEEMANADIQIAILEDGDPRGKASIASWRSYRKDLRNRVTGGVITGTRPVRPV